MPAFFFSMFNTFFFLNCVHIAYLIKLKRLTKWIQTNVVNLFQKKSKRKTSYDSICFESIYCQVKKKGREYREHTFVHTYDTRAHPERYIWCECIKTTPLANDNEKCAPETLTQVGRIQMSEKEKIQLARQNTTHYET